MKKIIALFILGASTLQVHAQTIFTYGKNKVSKDEFVKVFEKSNNNRQDYSYKGIKDYLNLYALYKMKVAEAARLQIDTLPTVQDELRTYKKQLAKSYLIDKDVNKRLLNEAYERSKEELEIAHILISSRGRDTTESYKRIQNLYTIANQRPDTFAALARQYSEDAGSAGGGGTVGYISALDVDYSVENAAYSTKVGHVSAPFRSKFGYHIVKVLDRRKSKGQVQVAQILIAPKDPNDSALVFEAYSTAGNVYRQLKVGADFDSLVKSVSDDRFSKNEKGVLAPFGTGQMDPVFEKAAFSLKQPGDIATPIKTEYGFHIIKLIQYIPNKPFDEVKDEMLRKMEKDGRMLVAALAFKEEEKKRMNFKENKESFEQLLAKATVVDSPRYIIEASKYANMKEPLFSIAGSSFSQYDFMQFVQKVTGGRLYGKKEQSFRDLYEMYQDEIIAQKQLDYLEKTNKEFRTTFQEYRNGILVFDLMDKNVWSKGINDQEGLKAFYNAHRDDYVYEEGFEGYIFESANKPVLEEMVAQVNNGEDIINTISDINNNGETGSQIAMKEGKFEYEKIGYPIDKLSEKQMSPIKINQRGKLTCYYITKRIPKGTHKGLDEAKGIIVADFQNYLEQQWHQQLLKRYVLTVNEKELKKLVK